MTAATREDAHAVARYVTADRLFRIGIAMCFIGHGAFGIITKEAWLPYFALVGIGPVLAYQLMPLVGFVDIAVGVVGFVSPRRAILLYMAAWATWTAMLRPLTGESGWELLERAGNYGLPLAFLLAAGVGGPNRWLTRITAADLLALDSRAASVVLRLTTVLLLFGHGALAVTGANGIVARHLSATGFASELAPVVGGFEIGLAVAVAVHVSPGLLVGIAGWKIATEMLFPISGAPFWEFVERGGSYIAPMVLAYIIVSSRRPRTIEDSLSTTHAPKGGFPMRAIRTFLPLVLIAIVSTPVQAQRGRSVPNLPRLDEAGPAKVLEALRNGGHILACRHAITDRTSGNEGTDLDDRSTQRNLSRDGEEQARRLGRAVRKLGIAIGEVYSSPYARTMESAELAFGKATRDDMLYGRHSSEELRAHFNRAPRTNNTVLMTHQGILRSALGYRQPGEGDCIVIRPRSGDEGPEVVANVTVEEWEQLANGGKQARRTLLRIASRSSDRLAHS